MKKAIIFRNILLCIPLIALLSFFYVEIIGWSVGIPYPESWMDEKKTGGELHPIKHWGFITVTVLVPFSLLLLVLSFVSVKLHVLPALCIALFLTLILYIVPISSIWGAGYILCLFCVCVLCMLPSILLKYKAYKVRTQS